MEQNMCIFGASSTWGAWDYEKAGWANRLRLYFDSANTDVFTYVLGVSGDTTNELLKRFDVEAAARKPNIIIFSIGDNDAVYLKSKNKSLVPLPRFAKNLQKLINKAKKYTNTIILIGGKKVDETKTAPVPWTTDYFYLNNNIVLYDKKIKELAEINKVHYIKVYDLIISEDYEDGLHPNDQGHQKLFLKIKGYILKKKIINSK